MTMRKIQRIALLAIGGGAIAAAAWIGHSPKGTLTADPTTTSPTPPSTVTPLPPPSSAPPAPEAPPAPPLP